MAKLSESQAAMEWNGMRTALLKAGEHYADETPWGKALIGYFEGVSEELE